MDATIFSFFSLLAGVGGVVAAVLSLHSSLRAKSEMRKELVLRSDELRAKVLELNQALAESPPEVQRERTDELYRHVLLESIERVSPEQRQTLMKSISRMSDLEQLEYFNDLLGKSDLKNPKVDF